MLGFFLIPLSYPSSHPHGAYSPAQQISPLHKDLIHLHGTCKALTSRLTGPPSSVTTFVCSTACLLACFCAAECRTRGGGVARAR